MMPIDSAAGCGLIEAFKAGTHPTTFQDSTINKLMRFTDTGINKNTARY